MNIRHKMIEKETLSIQRLLKKLSSEEEIKGLIFYIIDKNRIISKSADEENKDADRNKNTCSDSVVLHIERHENRGNKI